MTARRSGRSSSWIATTAGSASCSSGSGDGRRAEINALWVAPEARGRGGGVALCDACAAWATARACSALTLRSVAANRAALCTYEAAGFSVTGRRTSHYEGRTLDELVLSRRL